MSRESITRIKVVYDSLEELANKVVFVGGATVVLYADRPSAEARPTDDVDILVANIEKSLYPFGEGKGKYSIPTGRNIKKALTLEEVPKIFNYKAEPGTPADQARDYWVFIYLCNGMNVKDLCLLKRKNIQAEKITFIREKSKRTKRESSEIVVSLKPEARAIIAKWGRLSLDPDAYLFPHIDRKMNAERQRKV